MSELITACQKCGVEVEPDETTWPGKDADVICQSCWESECSASWWEMLRQLPPDVEPLTPPAQ